MKTILDKPGLERTIQKLSTEMMEKNSAFTETILLGIQTGGVFLADRIVALLGDLINDKLRYGKLDITFYRDDIRKELHKANQTDIAFSLEGKRVILIDDVLYTGRTIRASLDAILAYGRPEKVELCVLADRREGRQLPIQPDYYGITIECSSSEKVKVDWKKEEVIIF